MRVVAQVRVRPGADDAADERRLVGVVGEVGEAADRPREAVDDATHLAAEVGRVGEAGGRLRVLVGPGAPLREVGRRLLVCEPVEFGTDDLLDPLTDRIEGRLEISWIRKTRSLCRLLEDVVEHRLLRGRPEIDASTVAIGLGEPPPGAAPPPLPGSGSR